MLAPSLKEFFGELKNIFGEAIKFIDYLIKT